MRSIKGKVQGGAATSTIQLGCCALNTLNKLCASIMSPTQDGHKTNIFGDDYVAKDAMLNCLVF
jgi:hypothetical protein